MKVCRVCNKNLPDTSFYKKGVRLDGKPKLQHSCKTCNSQQRRERYDSEKRRRWHLQERFGITPEHYTELLESQDHKCAICGTSDATYSRGNRLHVDHDHATGEVRGLLCGHCNLGVGQFFDNTHLLSKAITYLKRNGRNTYPTTTEGMV